MKIVIDIDGTLCDEISPNIEFREPYLDRIAILNAMYDNGNEICIYTSRGMRSTGNAIDSDSKYRKITESQLSKWGVKYHSLFFGKPNADIYVDNHNMLIADFFRNKIPNN